MLLMVWLIVTIMVRFKIRMRQCVFNRDTGSRVELEQFLEQVKSLSSRISLMLHRT